jgi:hypothetical protein
MWHIMKSRSVWPMFETDKIRYDDDIDRIGYYLRHHRVCVCRWGVWNTTEGGVTSHRNIIDFFLPLLLMKCERKRLASK